MTLTITDNDTRGVKLEAEEQPIPAAGLSITEGDTGRYTVVLESQPTDTVEIAVASDDTAVHVSPTPLTFTKSDWKTAQDRDDPARKTTRTARIWRRGLRTP